VNINPTKLSLYDKILAEGGRVVKKGKGKVAFRVLKSRNQEIIFQLAGPRGDWFMKVISSSRIKEMQKTMYLHRDLKGYNIDTWDYSKSQGKAICRVIIDETSSLRRVFNKSAKHEASQKGTVTYYKKGLKPAPSDTQKIEMYGCFTEFERKNRHGKNYGIINDFFSIKFVEEFLKIKDL